MSTGHAPLAPSSAHRWSRCPGSYKLTKDLPDEETSYAKDGTAAHALGAAFLQGAREDSIENAQDNCPADLMPAVRAYVGYVEALLRIEDIEPRQIRTRLFVEVPVVMLPGLVYGTADAVICTEDGTLHVIDFKAGAGVFVGAEENEQLLLYGHGALNHFTKLGWQCRRIVMHIVQPRFPTDSGIARTWELDPVGLMVRVQTILLVARMIESGEAAELNPGDHCQFCKARHTCPALQERALATAQTAFAENPQPPRPVQMSPEQIARVLEGANVLEVWLRAVKERAHDLAVNGTQIPGHKLVQKIGNRKWTDEREASTFLTERGVDAYEPPQLISPAEAERRIGKGKRAKDLVDALTTRPVTGLALVPESDKRQPVEPAALSAFRNTPLPSSEGGE
jgi:hypothetical protein